MTMLPAVTLPDNFRDLGPVDSAKLAAMVARVSEETWQTEDGFKENKFNVFHHTRHIVFRFIPRNQDPLEFYAEPAWHAWKSLLLPIMEQAIAPYGFEQPEFPKAMLARLAAGAVIDLHKDGAGSNLVTHKIHVPLQTNPDALFNIGEQARHLELGQAYEVNNVVKHGVTNGGDEDRVHFIFEVFDRAQITADEPTEESA